MNLFSNTLEHLSLYSWKDICEVLFFTSIVYYFSIWLKRDRQKPLLLSFYAYLTVITFSYYANLFTITTLLITFAPVGLVLFIVLHQETLQRNFISLHNITPKEDYGDWVEHMIRSCLVAVGNNKPIHGLIEQRDNLTEFLHISHRFESIITKGLLDVLTQSTSFNSEKIIVIKDNGTLIGINGTWKKSSVDTWLAAEVKEQEQWAQDALFFTAKSDALYFSIDPSTRTFTLLAQGKIIETVSAQAARKTIKQYLGHFNDKGEHYAKSDKATSTKQSLS
jgi:hypothetical protein